MIQFPSLTVMMDETRTYDLGCPFILKTCNCPVQRTDNYAPTLDDRQVLEFYKDGLLMPEANGTPAGLAA